jgi:hypothetical protein
LPIIGDFHEGLLEDSRAFLDDQHIEHLEEQASKDRNRIQKFEKRLDRWISGDIKQDESFLDGLSDRDDDAADANTAKPRHTEDFRRAERNADRRIQEIGPSQWQQFLGRAKALFDFNDEQAAAGAKILADYRKRANVIMTSEWRRKVHENRVKSYADRVLADQPIKPWLYRLDMQYDELTHPLRVMGREFRGKILALVTDEQRKKAVWEMEKFATAHGMQAADLETIVLQVAATQPAAD